MQQAITITLTISMYLGLASCTYQAAKQRENNNITALQHQQNLKSTVSTIHTEDQQKLLKREQQNRRHINNLKNELDFLESQTKATQEQQARSKEIRRLLEEIEQI